ncbi:hypothetical protein OL229_10470 [Neisseriaceae bacterium JH1-16]|nr:hypothetical protein [Neisseriaceae bacterium JH1-16]
MTTLMGLQGGLAMDTHPMIAKFSGQAGLLDLMGDQSDTDDAVARLAAWMELAEERLTKSDMAVLVGIGGVLYRDSLNKLERSKLASMGRLRRGGKAAT